MDQEVDENIGSTQRRDYILTLWMEAGFTENMELPVSDILRQWMNSGDDTEENRRTVRDALDPDKTDEVIDRTTFADRLLPLYESRVAAMDYSGSPLRLSDESRSLDESFNASCTEADISLRSESSSIILRKENTSLKADLQSLGAAVSRLQTDNGRLRELLEQIEDREAALKLAENDAKQAKDQYVSLRKSYDSLEKSWEALRLKPERLEAEVNNLTLEIKEKENFIATLRETNGSLMKELETKDTLLQNLKADEELFQSHAADIHTEVERLRVLSTDWEQEKGDLEDKVTTGQLEIQRLQRDLEALSKSKNDEADSKYKWFIQQVEDLQMVLGVLQTRFPSVTYDGFDSDDDNSDASRERSISLSLHEELGNAYILSDLYKREMMLEEMLADRDVRVEALLEEIATLKGHIVTLNAKCEAQDYKNEDSLMNLTLTETQFCPTKSHHDEFDVNVEDRKRLGDVSWKHKSRKSVRVVDTISEDSAVESDIYPPTGGLRLRFKNAVNDNVSVSAPAPRRANFRGLCSSLSRYIVMIVLMLLTYVAVFFIGMYFIIHVLYSSDRYSSQRSLVYTGVQWNYEPPPV